MGNGITDHGSRRRAYTRNRQERVRTGAASRPNRCCVPREAERAEQARAGNLFFMECDRRAVCERAAHAWGQALTCLFRTIGRRKSIERKKLPRSGYNPFRSMGGCVKLGEF